MTNSLQEKFKTEIAKSLQTSLGIKNVNAVPALSKIVVNLVSSPITSPYNLISKNILSLSLSRILSR